MQYAQILKSRTFWSGVALFMLGGFQAIEQTIEPQVFIAVTGVLTLAIGYFRANARVQF